MAGAGYKLFNTGDVLTAQQVNEYLMQQTTMVFASAAARTSALSGVLAEGMVSYLQDTNTLEVYDGSAWVGATGDITGLTAGTGISISSATGPVPTITNTVATEFDSKGDLIVGTGSDAFDRLGVGNDGESIVADSSATTGLRWQSVQSRNIVYNSAFDVWQRGTSIALTTTSYTADRWFGYGSVAGRTVSRQTGDTGFNYCARVQRDSGNTNTSAIYFGQPFEIIDCTKFAGKTITWSFYARAGANYSRSSSGLDVVMLTGTGNTDSNAIVAGYTGQTSAINQTATLTTSWQRFQYSATLPSNVTQFTIYYGFAPTGTAGANDWFEVSGVQLELGSVATPYVRSSGNIAGELAACQRYYWRVSSDANSPYAIFNTGGFFGSTTAYYGTVQNPVQMRSTPSAVDFANLTAQDSAGSNYAVTALAIDTNTDTPLGCRLTATVSGATSGRWGYFLVNNSSSAYLGINAEL